MDTSRLNGLRSRANQIKIAKLEGENTALRVGSLLEDMLDYDKSQSDGISSLERNVSNINRIISSGGGGGGGGTAGVQRVFFLNITHDTVPSLPSISSYSSESDTFVTSDGTWSPNNVEPLSGQDTYAAWMWFVEGSPSSGSGPVRIYNSETSSSNGEDGEELEWIYYRTRTELTAQQLSEINTMLSNCDAAHSSRWSQPDQYPSNWTDHPQGITEEWPWEYTAYRTSSNNASGKRVWGVTGFSPAVVWAHFGASGTDGDGVEYIFCASEDGRPNWGTVDPTQWHTQHPTEYQQDNYYLSPWTDNPVNIETYPQGAKQWVCVRKKDEGIWQPFSSPVLWSYYSKDGVVDGYTVDLSNENMPVGTDSEGSTGTYSNSCLVQVFHNGSPVSCGIGTGQFQVRVDSANISRSDGGSTVGITATPDSSNPALIRVSLTDVTDFDMVNAYIPIIITMPDTSTRTMTITLYGVAVGDPGLAIDLYVECSAIHVDADYSTVLPSTLSVGVKVASSTEVRVIPAGSQEAINLGYKFDYYYNDDSTHYTLLYDSYIAPSTTIGTTRCQSLTIRLWKKNSNNEFVQIDSEYIAYVRDGKDGNSLLSTDPYYYASTTSETPKSGEYGGWSTTIQDTGWGSTKPYLFYQECRTYSNDVEDWGAISLLRTWVDPSGDAGADAYSIIITPSHMIINESIQTGYEPGSSREIITGRSYDNADKSVTVQIKIGNEPQLISYTNVSCNVPNITGSVVLSADQKTITIKVGSINNDTASEGQISTLVSTQDVKFSQTVVIPFYINRQASTLFGVSGELKQYADDGDGVIRSEYTADIAATQQSLRSEYTLQMTKAGEYNDNLFGFHKGLTCYSMVPWIQGYGGVSDWVNNSAYVGNLGLGGVGGYITISFEAKTFTSNQNVKFEFDGNQAPTGTPKTRTVEITPTWKSFEFYLYLEINETQTSDIKAGKLLISPTGSSAQRIAIRNLKIERGVKKTSFSYAPEDEAYKGQGQLISNLVNYYNMENNLGSYSIVLNIPASGTWSMTDKDGNVNTSSVKTFLEKGNIPITVGSTQTEIYTLSFQARCSTGQLIARSRLNIDQSTIISYSGPTFIYPNYDVSGICESLSSTGETLVGIGTEWKTYYIRFFIIHSSSNAGIVTPLYISQSDNVNGYVGTVEMRAVTLEKGFVTGTINSMSLIEQTAMNISLTQQTGLNKAGINIENGTITLDANKTIVNGDLQASKLLTNNNGYGYIDMTDGLMKVFNPNGINQIIFGVDENGNILLQYLDKDSGRILWDLGPNGLSTSASQDERVIYNTWCIMKEWDSTSRSWVQVPLSGYDTDIWELDNTYRRIQNRAPMSYLAYLITNGINSGNGYVYQYEAKINAGQYIGTPKSNNSSVVAEAYDKLFIQKVPANYNPLTLEGGSVSSGWYAGFIRIQKIEIWRRYDTSTPITVIGNKEYAIPDNYTDGVTGDEVDFSVDTVYETYNDPPVCFYAQSYEYGKLKEEKPFYINYSRIEGL